MQCHLETLCRYAFSKPETSTYEDAHNGRQGTPAKSCKVREVYEPTLPIKYTTDYGENYIPHKLQRKGGHAEIKPLNQEDLSSYLHSVDDELNEQGAGAWSNNENNDLQADDPFWVLGGHSEYGDKFISPEEAGYTPDHRGKSIFKPTTTKLFFGDTSIPNQSITQQAYADFSSEVKPEIPIRHPCTGSSKYPRNVKYPVIFTPEDEERLMAPKCSIKYLKNLSSGIQFGVAECTAERNKTLASDLDWPKNFTRTQTSKKVRTFQPPYLKFADKTVYTGDYDGKSTKELYPPDMSRFPSPQSQDAPLPVDQQGVNVFWNTSRPLLTNGLKTFVKDENYGAFSDFVIQNQGLMAANLWPQKLASCTRTREDHVAGLESAGAGLMPFTSETVYQDELKWQTPNPRNLEIPPASDLKKLIYPSVEKGMYLSNYSEFFYDFPPQPRVASLKRR